MIAPAIIFAACLIILIGFILVTWAYDRGRADGRDEGRDEAWEQLGGDTLPPLDPDWHPEDTFSLTEKGRQMLRQFEQEAAEQESRIANMMTRSLPGHYYDECTMEWKPRPTVH
jgi:hypothetical protein